MKFKLSTSSGAIIAAATLGAAVLVVVPSEAYAQDIIDAGDGGASVNTTGTDVTITSGGNLGVSGNAMVAGTLGVSGATTLNSTMAVSGATTLASTLGVSGATTLNSTMAVSGATTLAGTLGVSGATTFGSDVGVSGNLTVVTNSGDTLNFNDAGLSVITDGGGTLTVQDTSVTLRTSAGDGFAANDATGTTTVTATNQTTITGGNTSLVLNNNAATFSSSGQPVRVTGVADGVNPFDAVNKRQLDDVEKRMSAGIAAAFAMTQIPQPLAGQNFMIGLGAGFFNGEWAIAVGGAAALDNGIQIKGALTADSASGSVGVGFGAGIGF